MNGKEKQEYNDIFLNFNKQKNYEISVSKLKGIIVLCVIFIIWVIFSNVKETVTMQKNYQRKIDSLISINQTLRWKYDSLNSEAFIDGLKSNRYEIALEMLESEDPKSASEFNKRFSLTE